MWHRVIIFIYLNLLQSWQARIHENTGCVCVCVCVCGGSLLKYISSILGTGSSVKLQEHIEVL